MQMGKVSEITYKRSVKKKLSSDLEGTEMKKRRYVLLTAALLLGLAACGGEK